MEGLANYVEETRQLNLAHMTLTEGEAFPEGTFGNGLGPSCKHCTHESGMQKTYLSLCAASALKGAAKSG